jgi:hypothetical protein
LNDEVVGISQMASSPTEPFRAGRYAALKTSVSILTALTDESVLCIEKPPNMIVDSGSEDEPDLDEDDNAFMQIPGGFEAEVDDDSAEEYEHQATDSTNSVS